MEHLDLLITVNKLISQLNYKLPFYVQLDTILQSLVSKHGFQRPHITLFDPDTGLLEVKAPKENYKLNNKAYSPGKGITGQVFTTGQSAIVPCMAENSTFCNLLFERSQEELEELAFICVPIFAPVQQAEMPFLPRELLGTLSTDSPSISEEDLKARREFLEIIANLISLHISYLPKKKEESIHLIQETKETSIDIPFIIQSKKMKHILEQATNYANCELPLLIYGERGTGKEYYARKVHSLSDRKFLPFTIFYADTSEKNPDEIMHALCGYAKNAFPSAHQTKKGILESAAQGIVYIDSIDCLPPDAQEVLLQLLTKGSIKRVGAPHDIPLNVRIIASASTSLDACVEQGTFNKELALRLKVQNLTLPPLRERKEDIIPLAEFFLKQDAQKNGLEEVKRISNPAMELLTSYHFTGNIPELRQNIEHALKSCKNGVIRALDLPPSLQTAASSNTTMKLSLAEAVESFEKEFIIDSLIKEKGNMFKAAQELKSSYRIINYKIKKYNINTKKYAKYTNS